MNDATLSRAVIDTPIGPLTLVASDEGLRAVLWPDERDGRVPIEGDPRDDPDYPILVEAARQIDEYFRAERRRFDVPLDPVGTDFQRRVWQVLASIDFGDTLTYGDVSEVVVGDRSAARAVGAAIGRNPFSILVPCHRVVGANGSLVGFAGGIDVKRRLLAHETGAVGLPFG
ncbi:MAG: methylated-DNA--[protein]-cysteine S-methyltransferase [Acidimicrobiales bacterium]|nr:methylated-DNA--[protein]-cysteine S-methyltransferase [Acidimicrobiales bacterium]